MRVSVFISFLALHISPHLPPSVAVLCQAGWVNQKKKGAKDRQDKEFR